MEFDSSTAGTFIGAVLGAVGGLAFARIRNIDFTSQPRFTVNDLGERIPKPERGQFVLLGGGIGAFIGATFGLVYEKLPEISKFIADIAQNNTPY